MKRRDFKRAIRRLGHIRASDLRKYRKYYDDHKLQSKVSSLIDVLGENILLPVLRGYYTLKSPQTPLNKKLLIMAGLGYFILPVDMIPDFLGVFGFVDDLAVITFVLNQVKSSSTPAIEAKANLKYKQLLHRQPISKAD